MVDVVLLDLVFVAFWEPPVEVTVELVVGVLFPRLVTMDVEFSPVFVEFALTLPALGAFSLRVPESER